MIEVGTVYTWSNQSQPGPVIFVVVRATTHRSSKDDRGTEGYAALILDGVHRSASWEPLKQAGDSFTFSVRSAMARDSRPL